MDIIGRSSMLITSGVKGLTNLDTYLDDVMIN